MFIYQPPESDRKIKSVEGRSPSRRVDQTINHVSKGCFPINGEVLKLVQEKINDGEYRADPEKLITDLKTDPGLLIHAARNLKPIVEDLQVGIDPIAALKELEEEKLQKLFAINERQVSSHRMRDMRHTQALCFQHTVISSHAADGIASCVQAPPGLAFGGALLRQLGHNLIAWNYPEIYTRALGAQRSKGADLNVELRKYLGVTPLQIAQKFSTDWNLCPELRSVVAPKKEHPANMPASEEPLIIDSGGPRVELRQLCEVTELFAQANDPVHYPQAQAKWHEVQSELQQHLGPDFLEPVYDKVSAVLRQCDSFAPRPLNPPLFPRKDQATGMCERAKALYEANGALKRCPDSLRNRFVQIYEMIDGELPSVDGLKLLVDSLMDYAGFSQGCLFLVDQNKLTLKPAMRIGPEPLGRYRSVRIFENHPVAQALGSLAPLKQEAEGILGGQSIHVCGALGNGVRPGVLYLEINPERMESLNHLPLVCFQAVKQALLDCLGESVREKD